MYSIGFFLALLCNLAAPGSVLADFAPPNLVGYSIQYSWNGGGTVTFDASYTYFNNGDPPEPYTYQKSSATVFVVTNFDPANPTVAWSHIRFTMTTANSGSGYDLDDRKNLGAFQLIPPSPPTIITSSPLPAGAWVTAYSQTLAASGVAPPYTWSIVAGTLPAGLTLSSSGVLSGTPTGPTANDVLLNAVQMSTNQDGSAWVGTFTPNGATNLSFTVQVTDGNSLSSTKSFSLPLGITVTNAAEICGVDHFNWIQWVVHDDDPQRPRDIQGNQPSVPYFDPPFGGWNYFEGAADYLLGYWDEGDPTPPLLLRYMLSSHISPDGGTLSFNDAPGTNPGYSIIFRTALQAVGRLGGTSPVSDFYKWGCSNRTVYPVRRNLDVFLVVSAGVTALGTNTLSELPLEERLFLEANGVSIPPVVTTLALPGGLVGISYNLVLQATNGTQPYSLSLASNSLPSGLSLSTEGIISGTPHAVTNVSCIVQVAGSDGLSSTKVFGLAVGLARPTLAIGWGSGLPRLNLTGYAGSNYVIQASSNLLNWLSVATNTMPANGQLSLSDPGAASRAQRFYRAVLP